MENNKIKIRIYRKDPEKDAKGFFQEFDVPIEEGMVVLDAVNYITEHYDPTIAVRWNCKAARCGSCAAEINGMPKLMCKTRIEQLGEVVSIEPMHAFPLVKDLVTDVNENYETERAMPGFAPKEEKVPWVIDEIDVLRSQEFRKCIECFLCQDVCHVIRDHATKYVGPRHIAKAASLDMHPVDSLDRSKILTEERGWAFATLRSAARRCAPNTLK